MKTNSEKISWKDGKTTWTHNLILELKHPETRPREIYLHRVAKIRDFVEGSPPASDGLDAFLALISDRDEISSKNESKDFPSATIGFGPVEVELEFNIENLSLDGTFKLAGLPVGSFHMVMNQAATFNLPDVLLYRKIKAWLWVSPISVDLEIRYESLSGLGM